MLFWFDCDWCPWCPWCHFVGTEKKTENVQLSEHVWCWLGPLLHVIPHIFLSLLLFSVYIYMFVIIFFSFFF